jgi:hypothetical protein
VQLYVVLLCIASPNAKHPSDETRENGRDSLKKQRQAGGGELGYIQRDEKGDGGWPAMVYQSEDERRRRQQSTARSSDLQMQRRKSTSSHRVSANWEQERPSLSFEMMTVTNGKSILPTTSPVRYWIRSRVSPTHFVQTNTVIEMLNTPGFKPPSTYGHAPSGTLGMCHVCHTRPPMVDHLSFCVKSTEFQLHSVVKEEAEEVC